MMLLNYDFSQRVIITPDDYQWIFSPWPWVERMMLDRIGRKQVRATLLVKLRQMSADARQPLSLYTQKAANWHGQPQRQVFALFSGTSETVLLQKLAPGARMLAEQRSTTYPSQIRVKRRFLVLLAYLQNRDELSAMLFSKAFVGSRSYAYLGRMR